jgi:hypothetical protein
LIALLVVAMMLGLVSPGRLPWNNALRWRDPGPGVEFPDIGQALSERPILSRTGELTVELWLVPGFTSKPGNQEIVSFYDNQRVRPLLLGQFSSGFILRGREDNPEGEPTKDRYLELADSGLPEPNALHHLAVTVGQAGARLHVNGHATSLTLPETVALPGVPFGGHLMLGNSSTGWRVWLGGVYGLAVYERVLDRAELLSHAADPALMPKRSLRTDPSVLALYRFEEGAGRRALSTVMKGPDLIFPDRMTRPTRPDFLSNNTADLRDREWLPSDILRNIVGFMPLGFLVAWRRGSRGVAVALAVGICFSLGVELTQSLLPGRDSSAVDLVSNSLGGLAGGLLAHALSLLSRRK